MNMVMSQKQKVDSKSSWLDYLLWATIIFVVVGGSYSMYYFREQIGVFRLLLTFCGLMLSLLLASRTQIGNQVIHFANSAWVEMAKVAWPKPHEARHISIVVVCAVVIITLMMWLMDSLLTVLVQYLLG